MIHRLILTIACISCPHVVLGCNLDIGEPLLPTDVTFQEAAEVFTSNKSNKYARIAAYETMLRVKGAAFGAVLRDGYLNDLADIVSAATYCEVMRSNGAVARVTGLPDNIGTLSEPQQAQILTYSFTMNVEDRDWDQGCISTYDPPAEGCNNKFFISARDGVITFRLDSQSGTFKRQDGEFIGTIELYYGGPYYTVPAKLVLQ